MWNDLETQMRRVAAALANEINEEIFAEQVAAATLDSMRFRGTETVPEAGLGIWNSVDAFFHQGGRRDWASVLTADDLDHFDHRLDELAPEAKSWILDEAIESR